MWLGPTPSITDPTDVALFPLTPGIATRLAVFTYIPGKGLLIISNIRGRLAGGPKSICPIPDKLPAGLASIELSVAVLYIYPIEDANPPEYTCPSIPVGPVPDVWCDLVP